MRIKNLGRFAAIFAVILSGSAVAFAQDGGPGPAAPTAEPCAPLKKLYAHKHWRDAHPLQGENPCPLGESRTAKLKKEFFTYRAYRKIAHESGLHEGDPYLEWLPRIPAYVITCETRGYYGERRWHADNGIAKGPAQLVGTWFRHYHLPWPIDSNQDKLRYWEAVADLWGNTSWDCA